MDYSYVAYTHGTYFSLCRTLIRPTDRGDAPGRVKHSAIATSALGNKVGTPVNKFVFFFPTPLHYSTVFPSSRLPRSSTSNPLLLYHFSPLLSSPTDRVLCPRSSQTQCHCYYCFWEIKWPPSHSIFIFLPHIPSSILSSSHPLLLLRFNPLLLYCTVL